MKKILVSLFLLSFSSVAVAGPYGHRHHHHRHWHSPPVHHWVVPALIGGAVVYAATRPDHVVVQQPAPVVLNSQYIIVDGMTYKKELMIINGISQEIWIRQ